MDRTLAVHYMGSNPNPALTSSVTLRKVLHLVFLSYLRNENNTCVFLMGLNVFFDMPRLVSAPSPYRPHLCLRAEHRGLTSQLTCVECGVFSIGGWTGLGGTNYLTPECAEA